MALAFYTALAGCTWLVLWAIGSKPFDAFLVAVLIMILAAGHYLVAPFLPGNHQKD